MEIIYRTVDGDRWRCVNPERLYADVGNLDEPDLAAFHATVGMHPRAWRIARRLYGIMPCIPPAEYDNEDLRVWTTSEIAADLGIKTVAVGSEVATIAGLWRSVASKVAVAASEDAASIAKKREMFKEELPLASHDEILKQAGFGLSIFTIDPKPTWHDPIAEKEWFIERVQEMRGPLADKMAKDLARQILLNALQIRRLEAARTTHDPLGERFGKIEALLNDLQTRYQAQLVQLDRIAPWMGKIGGGLDFKATVTSLVSAHQEWYANNSRRLVDGMLTALEIEVAMRTSVQGPQPQYRPDVSVAVAEARANLWNPNYVPGFKATTLKRLRRAFLAAEAAVRAADGITSPDLLRDDAEGEYEELVVPQESGPPPAAL